MWRTARQGRKLALPEMHRLPVNDEVDLAGDDVGHLVLWMPMLFPTRRPVVAIQRGRELIGMHGRPKDAGTHLLVFLLLPVKRKRFHRLRGFLHTFRITVDTKPQEAAVRFASVIAENKPVLVVLQDDRALPVLGPTELGKATPTSFLLAPELGLGAALPLDELTFRALVPNPGKIICVGLNYAAHAAEAGRQVPEYPALFAKFPNSLTGPYDAISCPPESSAIDYEGELAVVIGERGRRVSIDRALALIAGVSVANDVTMRDFQNLSSQWLQGKAWETSTPVGPALVTLDEAGDLGRLELVTRVNGAVVQEASTDQMVRGVATLVSTISIFTTLEPGDLILTGTPAGVGFRREPPLLLHPGDTVSVELEGIGRIENRFVAE